MIIKPTKGRILGRVISEDYVSPGGIVIVQTMKKKKPKRIEVLAIGDPFENEKGKPQTYRAKPGDVAWFKMRAKRSISLERKLHLILDNEDILAVER